MSATAVQRFQHEPLIHPRGHTISAYLTCPGCGIIMFAKRLNLRNGVHQCSRCKLSVLIGLSVFVLPHGPDHGQLLAPDYSLPGKERTAMGLRSRSRRSRKQFLCSVGLDDPMPQIALERYCGQPINSVTVVPGSPTSDNVQSVKS